MRARRSCKRPQKRSNGVGSRCSRSPWLHSSARCASSVIASMKRRSPRSGRWPSPGNEVSAGIWPSRSASLAMPARAS